MKKNLIGKSKFMSLVLRHNPGKIGLELDEHGWADVQTLIDKSGTKFGGLSLAEIQEIVATNDKKRFMFSDDGQQIRASQGHSINVDLELTKRVPPELLYHGTATKSVTSIRLQGIQPLARQYVHLSVTPEIAREVGARHGKPVIINVLAQQMHSNDYAFYLSENGVWLTAEVPVAFLVFSD